LLTAENARGEKSSVTLRIERAENPDTLNSLPSTAPLSDKLHNIAVSCEALSGISSPQRKKSSHTILPAPRSKETPFYFENHLNDAVWIIAAQCGNGYYTRLGEGKPYRIWKYHAWQARNSSAFPIQTRSRALPR